MMDFVLLHVIQDPVQRVAALDAVPRHPLEDAPQLGGGLLEPALSGAMPFLEQRTQGGMIGGVMDGPPALRRILVLGNPLLVGSAVDDRMNPTALGLGDVNDDLVGREHLGSGLE